MQLAWLWRGFRTGILTTQYPAVPEVLPTGFRGRPVLLAARCRAAEEGCDRCIRACLPAAISRIQDADGRVAAVQLDYGSCVMCGLCVDACPTGALTMTSDFELSTRDASDLVYTARLQREATDAESAQPIADA